MTCDKSMLESICLGEEEDCVSGSMCMYGLRVVPYHFISLPKSLVQQANDRSNDSKKRAKEDRVDWSLKNKPWMKMKSCSHPVN